MLGTLVALALSGLAQASSLFLVAVGLSLIFGVTRIVNFAHGSLYMLGAYLAVSLMARWTGTGGYWLATLAAALIVGALGAVMEMVVLRRLYASPELQQLLATLSQRGDSPYDSTVFRCSWPRSDRAASNSRHSSVVTSNHRI